MPCKCLWYQRTFRATWTLLFVTLQCACGRKLDFAEAQCQVTVLGASTPTSSSCCHLPLLLPASLLICFHSTPLTLPMKSSPPPAPLLPEIHQLNKLKTSSSHVMKPHTESPGRGQNAEGVGRSGEGRDQNTDVRERRVSVLETQVW